MVTMVTRDIRRVCRQHGGSGDYAQRHQTRGHFLGTIAVASVLAMALGCGSSGSSSSSGNPKLQSISVSPNTALIKVGATSQLSATGQFSDGSTQVLTNVTWSTANPQIATVSSTGTVTGVGGGTAKISAVDSGITGQATITVAASAPPGGGGSGSTGIAGNKAYIATPSQNCFGTALQPKNPNMVTVVDLGATLGTSALVTKIAMPTNYIPDATAASNNGVVLVTSCSSKVMQIIDSTTDQIIASATAPVGNSVYFSGGSCFVCGVIFDPNTNQAILDTANGIMVFDPATRGFSAPVPNSLGSENFGYDPNLKIALNPIYNTGPNEFQLVDLGANTTSSYSTTITRPDAAAVDALTHIGVIPDESSKAQLLVNIDVPSGATPQSTTFPQPTSCPELTMVSIDSSTHEAVLAAEGDTCFALELLSTTAATGAPPAPSTVIWGHMPSTPDGLAWHFGLDPHSVATFVNPSTGGHFAFMVDQNGNWVARIDLAALAGANASGGGIDLTPYVEYLQAF